MYGIIYVITNTVSGKQYVGQTRRTLTTRWRYHLRAAGSGESCALSRAIRKYGADTFRLEQIDIADSLEDLNNKEVYYIRHLQTFSPNGYNLTTGGEGYEFSKETLQKISASVKNPSEETRRKISVAGRKRRLDSCKKGHPLNVENISIAADGRRRCLICHYLRHGYKLPEKLAAILSNSKKNSVVL